MINLKPCPFCGELISIGWCDDEGNIKDEAYAEDPYSGLRFYLKHETFWGTECPIATHKGEFIGSQSYDEKEEAIDAWNRRVQE